MPRRAPLFRSAQVGLTLIELMIALGLGLIIVAALGYLFVGNRQAFRVQDNLARMQENGRYAMEILGQDLRMVGYIGCARLGEVTVAATASGATAPTPANILAGSEGVSGADGLSLRRVDGRGAVLTGAMSDAAADVPIPASPHKYAAGTPFIIADCLAADLFTASAKVNPDATAITHAGLSKAYGADAMVFPFASIAYSIASNPAGNPALYREVNGTGEEVAENVKDMQVVYGVDTDTKADGEVNAYVRADQVTDWTRVLAVRVSLLLRSPQDNIATGPPAVFWDRDNDGVNDFDPATDTDAQARRLLYVYTSTFGLRNRVR
ncbi:MAG: PilW family protein [Thiobacillaceae bacterium]